MYGEDRDSGTDLMTSTTGVLVRNKSYLGMKREGWIERLAVLRVEGEESILKEAINNVDLASLVNGQERVNTIKRRLKENLQNWKDAIDEGKRTGTRNVTLAHYRPEGLLGQVANYVTSQIDCIRGRDLRIFTQQQLVHVIRVCGLNSSTPSLKKSRSKTRRRRTISDLGERRYLCRTVDCT